MNTYKIIIVGVSREMDRGNLKDVAKAVKFKLIGTNSRKVSIEQEGYAVLSDASENNFTPYFELTKEQVSDWVRNSEEYNKIKDRIDSWLDQCTTCMDLPWQE